MSTYQYKISEEVISRLIKRSALNNIILLLVIQLAVLGYMWYAGRLDVSFLTDIIPIFAIVVVVATYRQYKRNKTMLSGYLLTVTDNIITRELTNIPSVSLYHNEVTNIEKTRKGVFVISGKNGEKIYIPHQVENYSILEARLSAIQPISAHKPTGFMEKYGRYIGWSIIPLFIGFVFATNKLLLAICGICLLTIGVWSIIVVQKSKAIDMRTKRKMWIILIPLLSIVVTLVSKFLNLAP